MPTYRMIDFLKTAEVLISPQIQERSLHPFTMSVAREFFQVFALESFVWDGRVGSVFVYDAQYNPRGHSYAICWLWPDSLDHVRAGGRIPTPVATLELSVSNQGGPHDHGPRLSVKPWSGSAPSTLRC